MNREAKQEIRRALLGRTEPAKDGSLVVLEKGQARIPIGIADGASAVRFLGIFRKSRRLKASCSEEKAKKIAFTLMQDVGRVLRLSQQPGVPACLIRYLITRPVVLIFDYQNGIPVLTAWTGRGMTGWISLRRALRSFIKRMPKELTPSDQPVPKDEDKAGQQKPLKKKQQNAAARTDHTESGNSAGNGVPEETPKERKEQTNESES